MGPFEFDGSKPTPEEENAFSKAWSEAEEVTIRMRPMTEEESALIMEELGRVFLNDKLRRIAESN